MIDLSVETLKALAMPSKRPAPILEHLERQADTLVQMQGKIRDQIRRLQVEERYLKKKLSATPLEADDIEAPSTTPIIADEPAPKPKPFPAPRPKVTQPPPKPDALLLDDSEEEEEDEDELPPSLQNRSSAMDFDAFDYEEEDDDEDVDAMAEMRRILASRR